MTKTITTAELAAELDTTPRELRKFLRADAAASDKTDELPGKGKRYALPSNARAVASMRKKFAQWQDAQKVRTTVDEVESDNEDEGDVEDITADLDTDLDSLDDSIDD